MKIVKDNDGWMSKNTITYLDDVAYYIYQTKQAKKKEAMLPQWYIVNRTKIFHEYYDKAKQFIRLEKLNKIKNNLENK